MRMDLRSCRAGLQVLNLVLVIALATGATVLAADPVTVPALKAAFLYNFVKFTDWPSRALAPGQKLLLCIAGDDAVADALQHTIKTHAVGGHEIAAYALSADDGRLSSCHLLYISGLEPKRLTQLLEGLKGAAVFTVGDGNGFAESGGVAQLILENDRMRFAINVSAAERARLQLSSRLLSLAQLIKDRP